MVALSAHTQPQLLQHRCGARFISAAPCTSHLRSPPHFKMIPDNGSNAELRCVVVTADDQQIAVASMTTLMALLPSTRAEIVSLQKKVRLQGLLLFYAFVLIIIALVNLFSNNQDIQSIFTNAAKCQGGVPPRKYNAAHAPAMSHPVQNQLHRDVVQALRAGPHKAFASMLDNVTESEVVRQGVTIFAPSDEALSDFLVKGLEPEGLVRYHIVSGIMPYSNLLRLKAGSTLTTDEFNATILVTNATAGSFQVDDAVIVEPDLYTTATIAVHGINRVFNTTQLLEADTSSDVPIDGPHSAAFKTSNMAVFQFLMASGVLLLTHLTANV